MAVLGIQPLPLAESLLEMELLAFRSRLPVLRIRFFGFQAVAGTQHLAQLTFHPHPRSPARLRLQMAVLAGQPQPQPRPPSASRQSIQQASVMALHQRLPLLTA